MYSIQVFPCVFELCEGITASPYLDMEWRKL